MSDCVQMPAAFYSWSSSERWSRIWSRRAWTWPASRVSAKPAGPRKPWLLSCQKPPCGSWRRYGLLGVACSTSCICDERIAQADHLPVAATGSLRQQLHVWGRHATAVREGSLHVAREFWNCPEDMALSLKLGFIAAPRSQSSCLFRAAHLPAAGASVDLKQLLANSTQMLRPVRQDFTFTGMCFQCVPTCMASCALPVACQSIHCDALGSSMFAACMQACVPAICSNLLCCRWCSGQTHLILKHGQRGPDSTLLRHYSTTYAGVQLLGTFTLDSKWHLVAAARTSALYLMAWAADHPYRQCTLRTMTRDGALLKEHVFGDALDAGKALTSGWQNGSLLAVARTSSTFYVCSPGGHLQAISLARPAMPMGLLHHDISTCNQLAAICVNGQQAELLLVDLAQRRMLYWHSLHGLPSHGQASGSVVLALSSRNLAVWSHADELSRSSVSVLSTTLASSFVLPASRPSWDLLGKFLAVIERQVWLSVYAASGALHQTILLPHSLPGTEVGLFQWHSERSEVWCAGHRCYPNSDTQGCRALWIRRF